MEAAETLVQVQGGEDGFDLNGSSGFGDIGGSPKPGKGSGMPTGDAGLPAVVI